MSAVQSDIGVAATGLRFCSGLGSFGCGLLFTAAISYLPTFYTNVVGIELNAAAGIQPTTEAS
ncbi:hypothetical protein [Streptomyces sp. OE57]|uniref:hypothetical protein n=1 Tax=Streptomyces lacaronensis TaxID=3379885 RepID=UPI0039B7573C